MPPFKPIAICSGFAAVFLLGQPAAADDVGEFYKGKVVSFRVGFGAGGGYDVTARLVSKYLGAHIPGNPSITVENMPGAGSMRLANYLYNVAPKDGTVFGTFSSASILEPIVGNPGAKFEPAKFTWLGSMHTDLNSCGIWNGAGVGIKSFDDLVKTGKTITFGSSGPQSTSSLWPLFMKNVFNAPIKVIGGYKGIKAITLAMSRGEVDAVCGLFESSLRGAYADEHRSGSLKIFLQVGLERKAPLFGDAAQILDTVKGKGEEMERIVRFVFGPTEITRPVAAPPGVPGARASALRKALMETMKDPGTVADGKKIGVDWEPMPGDVVEKKIVEIAATPKNVVEKAQKLTKTQ
ncbi:MAG: hypothetical protein RLZ98_2591 [Pseudomonadota bacterium]|jgi:tripartite-type tricarboxylate transporter receptor subunit TctC